MRDRTIRRSNMRAVIWGLVALLPAVPLAAQQIKLPASAEKLADRASNVVDVNLDGSMLQLASRFLSDKDPDEARVKKLVAGLKSVMVKTFEFDHRGEYDPSDVEDLRALWKGPGWLKIVGVRTKRDGGNADVYLKSENGQISGIGILVADPTELTVVSVVGTMNPEEIRDLQGHFGIPRIDFGNGIPGRGNKDKADKAKDKDKDKDKDKEDGR
jgi:hypothetical protein